MKEIPLTRGKIAVVDDEDFERVSQFKWLRLGGDSIVASVVETVAVDVIYFNADGLAHDEAMHRLASPGIWQLDGFAHESARLQGRGASQERQVDGSASMQQASNGM